VLSSNDLIISRSSEREMCRLSVRRFTSNRRDCIQSGTPMMSLSATVKANEMSFSGVVLRSATPSGVSRSELGRLPLLSLIEDTLNRGVIGMRAVCAEATARSVNSPSSRIIAVRHNERNWDSFRQGQAPFNKTP